MSNLHQCNRCGMRSYECGYYDHGNNEVCENYVLPLDNSKMFSHILTTKGRISRTEYALTFVFALILMIIGNVLLGYLLLSMGVLIESRTELFLWNMVSYIPGIYLMVVAGIKRAHDSGAKWWYSLAVVALLLVINIFTIVLGIAGCIFLFKDKSEEGVNEYGSDPTQPYYSQLEYESM